ncbi:MAG: hypothetical protein AAB414_00230 [Patescibacteria group bacterium]|mgnify:CR=1 FL=1
MVQAEQVDANSFRLDLIGESPYAKLGAHLGINTTISGWMPLHEKLMRLRTACVTTRETESFLYANGYSLSEIARATGNIRQSVGLRVRQVERAPLVAVVRKIFPEHGWRMDSVILIVRDFLAGATSKEVAIKFGHKPYLMSPRRRALMAAGFPIPELPEIPVQETDREPSWPKLWSPPFKPLRLVLHDLGRKSPKSLAELFQHLRDYGFNVHHRRRNLGHYYYFDTSEATELEHYFGIIPNDRNIIDLRREGYSNPQIAVKVSRNLGSVRYSLQHLIAEGRVERRTAGRPVSTANLVLDVEVESLRRSGTYSVPQIADLLDVLESSVKNSISRRLLPKKKVERRQPLPEVINERDTKVAALMNPGEKLSNVQIADLLDATEDKVKKSRQRLIAAGEIERARASRRCVVLENPGSRLGSL